LPVECCDSQEQQVKLKEKFVKEMQAEVGAMKAVRYGMPRPRDAASRHSKITHVFQAHIDASQMRINLKEQDIRDELRRIDAMTALQSPVPQRIASVTAAFDAVKAL
jgi:hypothetical protein